MNLNNIRICKLPLTYKNISINFLLREHLRYISKRVPSSNAIILYVTFSLIANKNIYIDVFVITIGVLELCKFFYTYLTVKDN